VPPKPPAIAADVRHAVYSATVKIDSRFAAGSGVVLRHDRNGTLVLTADHVIADAWVRVNGCDARVLASDPARDLTLVRTSLPRAGALRLAGGEVPPPFPALAAGFTNCKRLLAEPLTVIEANDGYWITDRRGWPGRSGGPLVDARGNLVGIFLLTSKS